MSNYKVGDKFEIEIGSVYDDNSISLDVETGETKDNKLYRIKGFNSLVFDENGLNKLKKAKDYQRAIEKAYADGKMEGYMQGRKEAEEEHKNNAEEPIKTIKASELAVDTKVICCDDGINLKRYFSHLKNGMMYAFDGGGNSWNATSTLGWKRMTLEDGTVVLPE